MGNDPAQDMESKPHNALIAQRYEIREALGSGGAGAVFKAWDTQLHRFVAVKRWHPPEPLVEDPAGTERLWREAMTLAAIQHPNILTIHDFGVDDKGPYVITEFVDGETLDRVVQRGPFNLDPFADAAQQMLEALIAAHQAGLIHRDLKPQNVMRTRLPSGAWQYKILDFGLARFVTRPTMQSLEGNTSIYGSILYIAPEQLRHQPLDARTDIYALGCLFYYMLSGQNTVAGDTIPALIASHLEHKVTPLAEWRPDLPAEICAWVMQAQAFDPDERFPSAAAALAALHKTLPGAMRRRALRVAPLSQSLQVAPILSAAHGAPPPPQTAGIRIIPPPLTTGPIPVPPPPHAPAWRWILPALAGLLLLAAGVVALLRYRTQPAAATPPPAVESTVAEDVIAAWPPNIAEARRPLIQKYYEQMRDLEGPKWGSIGAILETLATLQFNAKSNPKEFRALANLTYHDDTGRTLGELDVVIWNVRAQRADVVYEAVVSDQLNRKAIPSRNQLKRFETALKEHRVAAILYPYDATWKFDPAQFDQARMAILGNQGALAAGFEAEVDLTRFEADFLQRKLIDYRDARRAKR